MKKIFDTAVKLVMTYSFWIKSFPRDKINWSIIVKVFGVIKKKTLDSPVGSKIDYISYPIANRKVTSLFIKIDISTASAIYCNNFFNSWLWWYISHNRTRESINNLFNNFSSVLYPLKNRGNYFYIKKNKCLFKRCI